MQATRSRKLMLAYNTYTQDSFPDQPQVEEIICLLLLLLLHTRVPDDVIF